MFSTLCLSTFWFVLLFHPFCYQTPLAYFFSLVKTSVWYFLTFIFSSLKFLLCSSVLLRTLSIFMTNYFELFIRLVAYLCLIKVFFWEFSMFFSLEHILLPLLPNCLCLSLCVRQNSCLPQSWRSDLVWELFGVAQKGSLPWPSEPGTLWASLVWAAHATQLWCGHGCCMCPSGLRALA